MGNKEKVSIVICLLLYACSTRDNGGEQSSISQTNVRDSIFLLSTTDIDGYGQETLTFYYLDTLNYLLSIVETYSQEVIRYHGYTINPGVSIEYDDKINGHIELLLKDGLIDKEVFKETNNYICYEYDSLKHLQGTNLRKARFSLSWKGDSLQQFTKIDSLSDGYNRLMYRNVKYDTSNVNKYYSPELLVNILNISGFEYLFAYLGLYGQLPVGGDYTIENVSYNNSGVDNRNYHIYKEKYSDDESILESENHAKGNERVQKRLYNWNHTNISILLNMVNLQ